MLVWRLLFGVLGLLLPLFAAGQVVPAAGWQPGNALGHLMLHALAQTPAGLLWAGTDEGVYRFDGTQVVSLNALRRRGPALPPVPCNALLATPMARSGWAPTMAFTASRPPARSSSCRCQCPPAPPPKYPPWP